LANFFYRTYDITTNQWSALTDSGKSIAVYEPVEVSEYFNSYFMVNYQGANPITSVYERNYVFYDSTGLELYTLTYTDADVYIYRFNDDVFFMQTFTGETTYYKPSTGTLYRTTAIPIGTYPFRSTNIIGDVVFFVSGSGTNQSLYLLTSTSATPTQLLSGYAFDGNIERCDQYIVAAPKDIYGIYSFVTIFYPDGTSGTASFADNDQLLNIAPYGINNSYCLLVFTRTISPDITLNYYTVSAETSISISIRHIGCLNPYVVRQYVVPSSKYQPFDTLRSNNLILVTYPYQGQNFYYGTDSSNVNPIYEFGDGGNYISVASYGRNTTLSSPLFDYDFIVDEGRYGDTNTYTNGGTSGGYVIGSAYVDDISGNTSIYPHTTLTYTTSGHLRIRATGYFNGAYSINNDYNNGTYTTATSGRYGFYYIRWTGDNNGSLPNTAEVFFSIEHADWSSSTTALSVDAYNVGINYDYTVDVSGTNFMLCKTSFAVTPATGVDENDVRSFLEYYVENADLFSAGDPSAFTDINLPAYKIWHNTEWNDGGSNPITTYLTNWYTYKYDVPLGDNGFIPTFASATVDITISGESFQEFNYTGVNLLGPYGMNEDSISFITGYTDSRTLKQRIYTSGNQEDIYDMSIKKPTNSINFTILQGYGSRYMFFYFDSFPYYFPTGTPFKIISNSGTNIKEVSDPTIIVDFGNWAVNGNSTIFNTFNVDFANDYFVTQDIGLVLNNQYYNNVDLNTGNAYSLSYSGPHVVSPPYPNKSTGTVFGCDLSGGKVLCVEIGSAGYGLYTPTDYPVLSEINDYFFLPFTAYDQLFIVTRSSSKIIVVRNGGYSVNAHLCTGSAITITDDVNSGFRIGDNKVWFYLKKQSNDAFFYVVYDVNTDSFFDSSTILIEANTFDVSRFISNYPLEYYNM
jgi:hypothetical protein